MAAINQPHQTLFLSNLYSILVFPSRSTRLNIAMKGMLDKLAKVFEMKYEVITKDKICSTPLIKVVCALLVSYFHLCNQ